MWIPAKRWALLEQHKDDQLSGGSMNRLVVVELYLGVFIDFIVELCAVDDQLSGYLVIS